MCPKQSISISSLAENFVSMCVDDKLDGSNYSLWAFMIKNILVGKGLWDIVLGDETKQSNSTSSIAQHLILHGIFNSYN